MHIIPVNADRKLYEIASSIGQNPLSWQGWHSLVIEVKTDEDSIYEDSLFWIKSIINTHMKDIQGHVYPCDNKKIHMICKPPSEKVLEQTGVQICDLVKTENDTECIYKMYCLSTEGMEYSKSILTTGNIFSIPVDSHHDIDNPLIGKKEPSVKEKKTLKPNEYAKILLVEDDPITRWMVRNALKDACDFATAPTANKAFDMYNSYQPDVVFLDINLPDKNGKSVLEWIIKNDPGACVVMFSSNDSLENITECLNDGASGFITKPFLKEDLLHYVNNSSR